MIGNLIYGLHEVITQHPIKTLVATGIFGFSKNRAIVNVRYALARVAFYTTERAFLDTGSIGKMLYKDLTLPKGAARPPIWKGSPTQRAVQTARQSAKKAAGRAIAPALRLGGLVLTTPVRQWAVVGGTIVSTGYAIGRTQGVRKAPPTNTGYVLGGPL